MRLNHFQAPCSMLESGRTTKTSKISYGTWSHASWRRDGIKPTGHCRMAVQVACGEEIHNGQQLPPNNPRRMYLSKYIRARKGLWGLLLMRLSRLSTGL